MQIFSINWANSVNPQQELYCKALYIKVGKNTHKLCCLEILIFPMIYFFRYLSISKPLSSINTSKQRRRAKYVFVFHPNQKAYCAKNGKFQHFYSLIILRLLFLVNEDLSSQYASAPLPISFRNIIWFDFIQQNIIDFVHISG